ncbi:MAG: alcohol dehydrogenase catalytic domain-containing protein, partial [Verrucomicrobiota bacterium]
GSDIHYYTNGRIGSQIIEYPFTIGHECAGVVDEVGRNVAGLEPGDPVAIEPAVICGQCDQCHAGRSNTCRKNLFLGCPGQLEGALSEFLVMPAENCFPLRPGTSPGLGTLSEPLAIGVYSVKQAAPKPGMSIGIFGLGPIGISILYALKARGDFTLYGTDPISERRGYAEAAGADWTGEPSDDLLSPCPAGLDLVFECCGRQEALDQALEVLKPGGRLSVVGIPATDRISFSIDRLRRKEITVINVRRQEGCVQEALDLIEQSSLAIDSMITHHFPFAQTDQAFDLVAGYGDGVLKAMIEF